MPAPSTHARWRLPLAVLLALVALPALSGPPTLGAIERRIGRAPEQAKSELWDLILGLSCTSPWSCIDALGPRRDEAERAYRLYLEHFGDSGAALRVRVFLGHLLFDRRHYEAAAEQYEKAVRLLASAQSQTRVDLRREACYHAMAARAHVAGIADRPLDLAYADAVRERLLAWAAGRKLPPAPVPRSRDLQLADVLSNANHLLSLLPPAPQAAYALLLAGRAHYERGETAQTEARLTRLIDRTPQALDAWSVTPLLIDSLLRNRKQDRVRRLARQLLEGSERRWWPPLLLCWDQARGRQLVDRWRPVFEALAKAPE